MLVMYSFVFENFLKEDSVLEISSYKLIFCCTLGSVPLITMSH